MNLRALSTLTIFFCIIGLFTSGILRFLDETPLTATIHMTFGFTTFLIVYFHLIFNWKALLRYLRFEIHSKEILLAAFIVLSLVGSGVLFSKLSLFSQVV